MSLEPARLVSLLPRLGRRPSAKAFYPAARASRNVIETMADQDHGMTKLTDAGLSCCTVGVP